MPLEPLAARLRLTVERGRRDLGDTGAAVFTLGRTRFGPNRIGADATAPAFRGPAETGFEPRDGRTG
ncbi:hypothetical protein [Kitasatospora sp. NPDC004272]